MRGIQRNERIVTLLNYRIDRTVPPWADARGLTADLSAIQNHFLLSTALAVSQAFDNSHSPDPHFARVFGVSISYREIPVSGARPNVDAPQ
jgi:hypothetical protein